MALIKPLSGGSERSYLAFRLRSCDTSEPRRDSRCHPDGRHLSGHRRCPGAGSFRDAVQRFVQRATGRISRAPPRGRRWPASIFDTATPSRTSSAASRQASRTRACRDGHRRSTRPGFSVSPSTSRRRAPRWPPVSTACRYSIAPRAPVESRSGISTPRADSEPPLCASYSGLRRGSLAYGSLAGSLREIPPASRRAGPRRHLIASIRHRCLCRGGRCGCANRRRADLPDTGRARRIMGALFSPRATSTFPGDYTCLKS